MVEHQIATRTASLDGHVATAAEAQVSLAESWEAVWRPRRGMLEARYFGETQEKASREFTEEAARLRLAGYRPSSASWSEQHASRWRAPWNRKYGSGFLVVIYRAPDETWTEASA